MLVPIRRATRNRRIIGTAVAVVFVFGPPVALGAGMKPSTIDNRALAPAPSLDKGFDALDMVGPWATDRLAGRGQAVETKSWIDFNLLKEMPASNKVVRGKDGYLFLGEDFTKGCGGSAAFERNLTSFLKLAEIIKASGRNAVFTLGPNKSSVVSDSLPKAVPKGDCALKAIAAENAVLDNFRHPLWVGVHSQLVQAQAAGKNPYSRTDTHWTTGGSAIFARSLAEQLDPGLAKRITITPTTITKAGDLTILLGLAATEDQPSAELSTGTTVTPDPSLDQFDLLKMDNYGKERWTTTPAAGLVPGKSLILGDSFAYTALGNLRPLFADGTFLWTGHVSQAEIVSQIKASDTVVVELVQRNVSAGHMYANSAFQAKVAAALGVKVP
jgi:alginate O-acetyltransferase complex protein AlgJ